MPVVGTPGADMFLYYETTAPERRLALKINAEFRTFLGGAGKMVASVFGFIIELNF